MRASGSMWSANWQKMFFDLGPPVALILEMLNNMLFSLRGRFQFWYHFAFENGNLNWYNFFVSRKTRHWPRSSPSNFGFWLKLLLNLLLSTNFGNKVVINN